jgi:hypothetical protein
MIRLTIARVHSGLGWKPALGLLRTFAKPSLWCVRSLGSSAPESSIARKVDVNQASATTDSAMAAAKADGPEVRTRTPANRKRKTPKAEVPVAALDVTEYSRMSPREHVLLRPQMYVGSTTPSESGATWRFDVKSSRLAGMDARDSASTPALQKVILGGEWLCGKVIPLERFGGLVVRHF